MDYKVLAENIINQVGGKENINDAFHCQTRLRLVLKDESIVHDEDVEKITGVLKVIKSAGQYQIVIGNQVEYVFEELLKMVDIRPNQQQNELVEETNIKSKLNFSSLLKWLSAFFTPLIPAMFGAGLLKSIMTILVTTQLVSTDSSTYAVLNFMSDATFYFLPFLLSVTVAEQLKCNKYLALTMAGIILHPTFTEMVATASADGSMIQYFGLPISPITYSSSVVPIILSVILLCYVEKAIHRFSPKSLEFFIKPILCILIVGSITLLVLGPIGFYIGEVLAWIVGALGETVGWLPPLIIGFTTPVLVMFGAHYAFTPLVVNYFSTFGYDAMVFPAMFASNIAQGGATLAVALKTKNLELKQLSVTTGISCLLGITEPAMYGVELQLKKPFLAALIGGGLSGLYMGITGVRCFAMGSPSLLSIPAFIGANTYYFFIHGCIALAIAFVSSFVIAYITGFEDKAL